MLATVIDIETSNWNVTGAAILSYAYVTFDMETFEVVEADVKYLYENDKQDWQMQAYKVHGLTKEFLKQYEHEYEDNLTKLYKLVQKGIIIGFNSTGFDVPFIRRYFIDKGYPAEISTHKDIDLQKIYRPILKSKKYSLTAVAEFCNLPERAIKMQMDLLFGKDRGTMEHHNAEYDVTLTYMLYRTAIQRRYIDGIL